MTDSVVDPVSHDSAAASAVASAPAAVKPLRRWAQVLLWPFGVVLPLVAIGFELFTHMCAEELFDPLPTPLHAALVMVVPLANLAALILLRRTAGPRADGPRTDSPSADGPAAASSGVWRLVRFANGLAIGVAAYYALVFLPLVPISVSSTASACCRCRR